MKIKDATFFKTIRGFLTVYLPKQKNASPNTIKSYRETLNLLLKFLEEKKKIPLHKASFSDLGHKTLGDFLDWLENERQCGISTRNQRLMAIKSFFKYAVLVDATQVSIQMEAQKVPIKKSTSTIVEYLSQEGLKRLLSQPNTKNDRGLRDQVMMILMYDAALRCQEILDIKVGDVDLNAVSPCVLVTGKGRQPRSVPITAKTAGHIKRYIQKFHSRQTGQKDDYLFYTTLHRERKQMSCDNVERFMKKYGQSARNECCNLPENIHPHQLRHTRAIHLYRDGMPLAIISEFLGHANVSTSQIYAYADPETKRKAIKKARGDEPIDMPGALWQTDEEMIKRLYGLK
jgi:site-specific recombinase XerD